MDPARPSLTEQAGSAFLWRGFGVTAEKLIFLVRLFILAQLLAPEDFGLIAIGMTALAVLSRLTDFGLVAALIQSGTRDKAQLDTAWTVRLMRAIGVNVVLLVVAPVVADAFGEASATNIIRALALTMLVDAAASIEIAALTRQLRYRALTMIQLGGALVNTVTAIYLASSLGAWALVLGAIAGSLACMSGSYIVAPYRPSWRLSRRAAEGLLSFGRWIFLAGVLGVMSETLLRWVISRQLGLADLGLFFVATRLAFLPTQLTGAVFHEVAFPVYARRQNNSVKVARAFHAVLIGMAVLLIPASSVLLVLVPGIVEHLLGERWQGATQITQLLLIASAAGLLGDAFRPLMEGTGQPQRILAMDALRFLVVLVATWVMIQAWGLVGAGLAYLVAVVVAQVAAFVSLRRLLETPLAGLAPAFAAVVGVSVAAAVVAGAISAAMPNASGLAAATIGSASVAAGAAMLLGRVFRLGLMAMLLEPFPMLASVLSHLTGGRRHGDA